MILEHLMTVVGPKLLLMRAARSDVLLSVLLYRSRPSKCTGVATICESTGVNICSAAIFIAGLENIVSGTTDVNIGGKLTDPKIVMASRNRKVAPTTRGNLAAGAGEGGTGTVPDFDKAWPSSRGIAV